MAMAAVPRTDQTRPMRTAADLEAAIAALPGRKERLRESFDRLVACAPLDFPLPFAWDDIDAHVSSLHASFSLRFRQMQQQQQQPHPCASVSSIATDDDDEQPRPGTASPEEDEQPHPGTPVSPTHYDDESIQEEDEEMVIKDEGASPVQEDDDVGKDREDQEMFSKDEDASPVQEDEDEDDNVGKDREVAGMGFEGATFCHGAGGTRDQELPVPMPVRVPDAGNRLLRQPYMAFPPTDVLSQLNLPILQRQQPFMPYQHEFPTMAMAMNSYNVPPMVQQQPYFNIPPMVVQQNLRQEFFPDFSQEFFPGMMMQPPMGIDHVLQRQYMAMAHRQHYFSHQQYMGMAMAQHQPYFPQQQQYMAQHEHRFPVAQAASAHGQGSNAKRGRRFMTTDTDAINVLMREPSKKSRPIQHHAEPKPIDEPIQKKAIYDYF